MDAFAIGKDAKLLALLSQNYEVLRANKADEERVHGPIHATASSGT